MEENDINLESFPVNIQKIIKDFYTKDEKSTKELVNFFVHQSSTPHQPPSRLPSQSGSNNNSQKAQFDLVSKLSQVMPTRKQVNLCLNKQGLQTFAVSDVSQSTPLITGTWTVFNVLLLLPIPKKANKANIVLTKLGDTSSALVFTTDTSDESSKPVIDKLQKFCKYKDLQISQDVAVVAYMGAKDGLLYLLEDFLFYGFRKPLKLLLIAEIESISFTLVTSRTFNIVVQLLDETVHEFEQISHAFYDRFQEYITRHGLSDQSLAAERKAKKQKTGPSELEKAEEESAGKSKGSGVDDDDDEDDEDIHTESEEESEDESEDESADESAD